MRRPAESENNNAKAKRAKNNDADLSLVEPHLSQTIIPGNRKYVKSRNLENNLPALLAAVRKSQKMCIRDRSICACDRSQFDIELRPPRFGRRRGRPVAGARRHVVANAGKTLILRVNSQAPAPVSYTHLHDEQFHQVMVGGRAGGLDDENVLAADIFLDFDECLAVGKGRDGAFAQLHADGGGNAFGQRLIGSAGKNLHN